MFVTGSSVGCASVANNPAPPNSPYTSINDKRAAQSTTRLDKLQAGLERLTDRLDKASDCLYSFHDKTLGNPMFATVSGLGIGCDVSGGSKATLTVSSPPSRLDLLDRQLERAHSLLDRIESHVQRLDEI